MPIKKIIAICLLQNVSLGYWPKSVRFKCVKKMPTKGEIISVITEVKISVL